MSLRPAIEFVQQALENSPWFCEAWDDWQERKAAAIYERTGGIPEELRWEVFERDNFTCLHCGSRRMLRADHIIPHSKGGKTNKSNLQTLCRVCNSKKGSRLP